MKYISAYLLANLAGKSGSEADIKSILSAVDATIDDDKLAAFLKAVEGKNVAELIAEGQEKLSSVAGVAAAPAAAAPAAGAAPAAEKAPEPEPEEEEEEEEDMDFDLFD